MDILGPYEAASGCLELKGQSVTALAFAPFIVKNAYFIAIGLDNGHIHFYNWNKDWKLVFQLDKR